MKSVCPDWTDFDVASFGNLLVELYAFVGDVLTFHQDNLARESRLVTATQRRSVMAFPKMLGYRLQGAQSVWPAHVQAPELGCLLVEPCCESQQVQASERRKGGHVQFIFHNEPARVVCDSRNPGEPVKNRPILGSLPDEPVAEIVQCGEPIFSIG